MKNLPSIVIAGPTASGKTAVAAKLAGLIGGEILSADSRQVYRYLDTGTNKAGAWNAEKGVRVTEDIPQHITDIIDPSGHFSAGDFVSLAREKTDGLKSAGKFPVIAGGTGLYIKALIDGLAPLPGKNPGIRAELMKQLSELGPEYLYRKLRALDPESAERNRHNPQRMIRALEVSMLTGARLSELQKKTLPSTEIFLQFGLLWPREELYELIDRRSELMVSGGMIEETRTVLEKGFSAESPGLQSLGYRSIVGYLQGKTGLEEVLRQLKLDTRHYAKRQMTWFRKDSRIQWLPVDRSSFDPEKIAAGIAERF